MTRRPWLAASVAILPALANRHGCITGATGTGKTVTLQVLAQALSGIAKAGASNPKLKARLDSLALPEPAWAGWPVTFWDVCGEKGYPVRATISDLGPLLLARMLNIDDLMQTDADGRGVVNILAADKLLNTPKL